MKRTILVGVLALALSGCVLTAAPAGNQANTSNGHIQNAVLQSGNAAVVQLVDDHHKRDRDDRYRRGRVYVTPYYNNGYYANPYPYGYNNYVYRGYDPYYGYYGYRDRDDYRHERHERREHERHERH
jgi:hypothetical protein